METKHKNALIGALLAVVFVMAVGYAAFAQTLTINGSAEITSTWDVHLKTITPDKTSTNGSTGSTGAQILSNSSASFAANLVSPGDVVTYTVVVENGGTIAAKLSNIGFTQTSSDNTVINFAYSGISTNDTIAAGDTATFYVTATYVNVAGGQGDPAAALKTKSVVMTLDYAQA